MKQQIANMIEMIQEYKRERSTLMPMYITERLSKSYSQYDSELQQSISFLTRKHEKSLIKRLNKLDGTITDKQPNTANKRL